MLPWRSCVPLCHTVPLPDTCRSVLLGYWQSGTAVWTLHHCYSTCRGWGGCRGQQPGASTSSLTQISSLRPHGRLCRLAMLPYAKAAKASMLVATSAAHPCLALPCPHTAAVQGHRTNCTHCSTSILAHLPKCLCTPPLWSLPAHTFGCRCSQWACMQGAALHATAPTVAQ